MYSPRRARTASVSAVYSPHPSPHPLTRSSPLVLTLPNELLYRIVVTAASPQPQIPFKSTQTLELEKHGFVFRSTGVASLDYQTLRSLALTCSRLNAFASAILYSVVAINDSDRIGNAKLFARTVVEAAHHGGIPLSPVEPRTNSLRTTRSRARHSPLQSGKYVDRLILLYSDRNGHGSVTQQRKSIEIMQASLGAILGLGPAAPSFKSPVLSSVRTLLISAQVVKHLASELPSPPWAVENAVAPTPAEMVLSTYTSTSTPITSFTASLTHLVIAEPSLVFELPSLTLSSLGGLRSLTHIALPRKTGANEENDEVFINDIRTIISERATTPVALQCVVLVAEVHSEMMAAIKSNGMREHIPGDIVEHYAKSTNIWKQMSRLAHAINDEASHAKGQPVVCVVPGLAGSWRRAVDKNRPFKGAFDDNIFRESARGRDLWHWAQEFERRRHRLEVTQSSN